MEQALDLLMPMLRPDFYETMSVTKGKSETTPRRSPVTKLSARRGVAWRPRLRRT